MVGDVPNGATGESYYYPLMMIGYVFCRKLISRKAPEVWSVMWFKQTVNNRPVTRAVLGATLDKPGKDLKEDTKNFRKGLLKMEGILVWRDDKTPIPAQMWEPEGITGQDFGHCAESYPLLYICS